MAELGLAFVFLVLASEVSLESLLAWILFVLCWLASSTLLPAAASAHFLLRTTGVARHDLRLVDWIML